MEITLEMWKEALAKAETETATQFNGQTCSLINKDGQNECPMCYFSKRMKHHLGLDADIKNNPLRQE